MTSTADALSGPWAANLRGWAATTALATVIVVMQELLTSYPHAGWIFASAALQLVASSLWGAAVAGLSRRLRGRVVPVASALMWTGIGVSRGVVGGVVAAAAGLDPEWIYRIGFWTLVSVCWMPLLTYALAQWEEHRRLLAARAELARALDEANARAVESDDERARRMASAVDDALTPAFDEIRWALRSDAELDEETVAAIADRLDELTQRTAGFTASTPVSATPRTGGRVSVSEASRDFVLSRPAFAALLAAAATGPLILPEAYRSEGWPGVVDVVLAIIAATAVLLGAFGLLRPTRFSGAQRSLFSRIGVVAAGLAGTGTLLVLSWDPARPPDLVLLVALPLVVATAASTTATAVALNATTVELVRRNAADGLALDDLEVRVRAADEVAAARLEGLVRGEVNGRVAGCALALGMLAHGGVPAASRERVIAGVLEQLDLATADLGASP